MTHASHLDSFRKIIGDNNVVTDPAQLRIYGDDWTKRFEPKPMVALFPRTVQEVQDIVRYCAKEKLAIVPSGGRTGLAGGAVAINGEVVLSLNRMNKIDKIDPIGMTIHCEAGATTESLQKAAQDAGLYFPLDLASKGSSHIGGNIATNAGGLKVIRFGNLRDSVAGIEVVLPNGDLLNLNNNLRKDNTGYDLKHLFIASEGTLGIIVKASIKLQPALKNLRISCMAVDQFQKIPEILRICNMSGIRPSAFEFFIKDALEIVLSHNNSLRNPFTDFASHYVLLEVDDGEKHVLEDLLEKLFHENLIQDAVISSSSAEFKGLWSLRENITESLAAYGYVRKNDISLAIDKLKPFIHELEQLLTRSPKEIKLILFGHIGDGNIHINYICRKDVMSNDEFQKKSRNIETEVFKVLEGYKGSISAEHGIGLTKKADLLFSRTKEEVEFMRQIKRVFDPQNIMNPGKIFD
jgi:FAD/FMN-containing dehydrogenase